MKKVILGIALLSQFCYGVGGTPEFAQTYMNESENFVRVDAFGSFPLYGSEEYSALIGANDENTEEGTIWKFIRGLGSYNPETGKNALNTVLSSHEYLNVLINSDNLSWEKLKSLVDAERNEDRKAWAVYSALAKALIDQHDSDKENLRRNLGNQHAGISEESTQCMMNEMLQGISEELNSIKEEVRQNSRNVNQNIDDILRRAQGVFNVNVESLVRELKLQYLNDLNHLTSHHNEQEERIREAYEAQKQVLNEMIDEVKSSNLQLKKEIELKDIVNRVYRTNPNNSFITSHSFISGNSQEIKEVEDIYIRRGKVDDIYNKVRLFSELFGREDLGVKAKASDLEAVRVWLDRTNENAVLAKYGNFSFSINIENLFEDMSWEKTNSFKGSDIGRPLLTARDRLERQISSLNGVDKSLVLSRLADIFQKNAADNVVEAKLTRPWHWRQHVHVMHYYKNDEHLGEYWKEFQGRYFGHSWGIFGKVSHASHGAVVMPEVAWRDKVKNAFQGDLNETISSIKNRAKLLFDFETNPNSPLQRLYKEAGKTDQSVINFPDAEIDVLVNQCNDFIKKTL